ncbi:MAG: helix-turn-helix domain-containing protein [Gemmatimonadaceae bacterium]|nr:helix-turn-helix domain-containing protein [Gemmatimonadaceae bacterium]
MPKTWPVPAVLRDLKAARKEAGYSLRSLATALDISPADLGFYETGRRAVAHNDAFLTRWLRTVGLPEGRLRELRNAREFVRIHRELDAIGATADEHAEVRGVLERLFCDPPKGRRPG